jgi:hypothetical protein
MMGWRRRVPLMQDRRGTRDRRSLLATSLGLRDRADGR